jgi:lipopolysaccharide transport system ATP-binding protein
MSSDDENLSVPFRNRLSRNGRADNIAIRVSNLSKCYQIYDAPRDRLKQFVIPRLQRLVGRPQKQYFREFWALKNICIEVKENETVGIIGRNGSGKSTLLQVICGMLAPTSGSVVTQGRVATLLELGSGFNPEFTGRENVYVTGAVLGFNKYEIDDRFDDIAAFADIGEFIERPVKTYSGGMFVRLAFAINMVAEPEIMIIDEALAVGDMNFQAKCMTALTRMQKRGATLLFVSHDIGMLKSLCSRGIYLDYGTVRSFGEASDVAAQYMRAMREETNAQSLHLTHPSHGFTGDSERKEERERSDYPVLKRSDAFDTRTAAFRYGSGGARVTYVELLDTSGQQLLLVGFNQEVRIRIHVEASSARKLSVNFVVRDESKISLTGCGFRQVDQEPLTTDNGGQYLVEYTLRLPLQEGTYSLLIELTSPIVRGETAEFVDVIEDAVVFRVERWQHSRIWSKVHLFPSLRLNTIVGQGGHGGVPEARH